jgi:hypothetical protein
MPYSKPPSHSPASPLSAAERKKKLLADGALHRANILIARADIAAGVQPAALTKDAISHFSATAKALLFDTLRNTAANPAKLSPLLMTGLSLLAKKSIRKPLMYAGVAGGAIAGAIYLAKLFGGNGEKQDNNGDQ